jgi:type 1 fimbriae regulatory protein FimB/type 1 fimbriae regulatory protein FimE
MQRAGLAARIPLKCNPHTLRHACGYALANKGVDTRAIQAWLGHTNIQVTVLYTQLAEDRLAGIWGDT